MKIKHIVIGKTEEDYLNKGISEYEQRLKKYVSYEFIVIPGLKNAKNMSVEEQKQKEGELFLRQISTTDKLILLDEKGTQFTSEQFSIELQKQMNSGIKTLIFFTGGPYGFSKAVYDRADKLFSLSKMTFSHQMVRLFFTEQLYRGFTILKGEPYHHK